jgi:hypothetical protein
MSLATYPVPLVDTPPGLLSSVLDLLELSDRHGAECEELAPVLAAFHSQARQLLTPVIMAYGSRASNGTPMIAVVYSVAGMLRGWVIIDCVLARGAVGVMK